MTDEITLKVGGRLISGWTSVRATRSITRCPSSFELGLTSDSTVFLDAVSIQEGQACTLSLGGDVVITGWADIITASMEAGSHQVQVVGRGRCADLVDCSAEWRNGQFGNSDILTLANKLGSVYQPPITATATCPTGDPIPLIVIGVAETSWSLLERISRLNGLLCYEGPDGNLIFAQTGSKSAASGFQEGVNVQTASYVRNIGDRYSQYACYFAATDLYPDQARSKPYFATSPDPNVTRNRKLMVVAEAGKPSQDLCEKRTKWEAARRLGQGTQVHITADNWRDAAGRLWEPNTLVQVSLPHLGLAPTQLCIGEVTYSRDERGTTADVVLMPKEAFVPEPLLLFPPLNL